MKKWVKLGREAAYLFFFSAGTSVLLAYAYDNQWYSPVVSLLAIVSALLSFYCFWRAALLEEQER